MTFVSTSKQEFARIRSIIRDSLSRNTRIRLRSIYFYGRKFKCSLCGSSVRTLLNSGSDLPVLRELNVVGGFRANDRCPVCLMGGRTRLVGRYLERELPRKSDKQQRILHFAPERELIAIIRRQVETLNYIATDIYTDHYDDAITLVRADITNLPWISDSFDVVICNHVLEHVTNDRVAMSELHRVVRLDGAAIIQVPIAAALRATIEDPSVKCPNERERRFGQSDHVRIYGMDFANRLQSVGFDVEVFDPMTAWGPGEVNRLRLDPNERLFVARKR